MAVRSKLVVCLWGSKRVYHTYASFMFSDVDQPDVIGHVVSTMMLASVLFYVKLVLLSVSHV